MPIPFSVLFLAGLLAGCSDGALRAPNVSADSRFLGAVAPLLTSGLPERSPAGRIGGQGGREIEGFTELGQIGARDSEALTERVRPVEGGAGFVLNFVDAELQDFVRAVFEEVLKESVVVDPGLRGRVTVRTGEPVGRATAQNMVREALRTAGAHLNRASGIWRVTASETRGPQETIRVVPLRHIDADAARSALQPLSAGGAAEMISGGGGRFLVIAGRGAEVESLVQVLGSLDVDELQGRSFALVSRKADLTAVRMENASALTMCFSPAVDAAVHAFVERLTAAGHLDERGLERARRVAQLDGRRVDFVLNTLGLVSDDLFAQTWSALTGLPVLEDEHLPERPVADGMFAPAFLRHARILPLRMSEEAVEIAVVDPLDTFAARAVAARSGRRVERRLSRPNDMPRLLERLYGGDAARPEPVRPSPGDGLDEDLERLRDLASDAPVIRLAQAILERAVEERASDVHLSVSRRGPMLRLRVDGVIREIAPPPGGLYGALVSRIKIMGGLDIAERRLPQDGAARVVVGGREIDLRIATMPHLGGEGVVLRVLDRASLLLDLEDLGATPKFVQELKETLAKPNGLILVTGATGSGKTTTLYAALKFMARPDRNIVTIEDPVEYQLDGITQIEIDHRIGFDFATALRAVLRQDPDVVLVGEIRDAETARIAMRAAMTGHLVLASLHTNCAVDALARLTDMGVEPYLIGSCVRAIIAQRLVRRLCPACRSPVEISPERVGALAGTPRGTPLRGYGARGCARCQEGYSGRRAVTEFMAMSEAVKALVAARESASRLTAAAREAGMTFLADNALDLVAAGETSFEEVERILGSA